MTPRARRQRRESNEQAIEANAKMNQAQIERLRAALRSAPNPARMVANNLTAYVDWYFTARLSALATEQLPGRIPHRDCKTPSECLKASACLDGWHCAHGRPDDILDRK